MNASKTTQQALNALYKNWPEIKRFLASKGCPAENAEDIFQEALLIYLRKSQDPTFILTTAPIAYIKSVCKFLWYNESRRTPHFNSSEFLQEHPEIDGEWMEKEMKLQALEKVIGQLGSQCRQLLELFYGWGVSMVDIAKKIGLRNDKVAKAQKYRCIQKAKELLNETSISNA